MAHWVRHLATLITACFCMLAYPASITYAQPVESFDQFIRNFEGRARKQGISASTYRTTMSGLTADPRTPNLISSQPEFTTPIWKYLETRISSARIQRGRKAFARNKALLTRIGQQTGVDPYLLAAFWGMESDYGAVLGNKKLIRPIIRSLATVVHQHRGRVAQDEAALVAALRMVQDYGWQPNQLVGSWAGAIGHTQLIVTGIVQYGRDGDGDGKIDLHNSLADALASTANYLNSKGYVSGVDWGYEVSLPKGFDYTLATREQLRPAKFFAARGVTRVENRQFLDLNAPVFLYVPAGANGPKFLMTANYLVIKAYNFSDSYSLSVAHLTDRLKGSGGFVAPWPKATKFPNLQQRIDIQTMLKKLGYYDGDVDGRIGPISQLAYQRFQAKNGVVADGFITLEAYNILRTATR